MHEIIFLKTNEACTNYVTKCSTVENGAVKEKYLFKQVHALPAKLKHLSLVLWTELLLEEQTVCMLLYDICMLLWAAFLLSPVARLGTGLICLKFLLC